MLNINDYIGKKYAVECSSKEEWQQIMNLAPDKADTEKNRYDNSFSKIIALDTFVSYWTVSNKEQIKNNGFTILQASNFLNKEEWVPQIGEWIVSLIDNDFRNKGDVFQVIDYNSSSKYIIFKENLKGQLNSFRKAFPDEIPYKIPEYVEYIKSKYKGEIVKVEDWKCGSWCKVIFANGQKEQPFKHLVKTSTKEAYEQQHQHFLNDEKLENVLETKFQSETLDSFLSGTSITKKETELCNITPISISLRTKKKNKQLKLI